jgi:hypothetical protein
MGANSSGTTMAGRYLTIGALAVGLPVLAALILLAPILLFAWLDPVGGPRHPTDAQLIAQLAKHRADLEEVATMAQHDSGLQRLAPDFIRPETPANAGISDERIATYRRLLARAGVAHGILNGDDEVWFLVSTRGLAISGSAKGFVYCAQPDPDARIVAGELDHEPVPPRGELVMRHVEGRWWLMLDTR